MRLGDATEPATLGNLESIVFLQKKKKTKFEARLQVEWQMRGCTFLLRALGVLESLELRKHMISGLLKVLQGLFSGRKVCRS